MKSKQMSAWTCGGSHQRNTTPGAEPHSSAAHTAKDPLSLLQARDVSVHILHSRMLDTGSWARMAITAASGIENTADTHYGDKCTCTAPASVSPCPESRMWSSVPGAHVLMQEKGTEWGLFSQGGALSREPTNYRPL